MNKIFLEDIGVDGVLSETPINRFEEAKKAVPQKPTAVTPVQAPMASAASSINLDDVKTREDLQEAIRQFDGSPLKKTAMNLVFSDGNPEAEVMLIGEAPGADEDRQGKPFVGQSGQLLRKIFESVGLSLDKIYISNVLPWRPPGNRQPTPAEIEMFRPFLKKHIELIKPKCLMLIGGTACKALLNTREGITKIRGKWLELDAGNGNVPKAMATYHPAYLLRSPSRKRDVWQDMLVLKDFLAGKGPEV